MAEHKRQKAEHMLSAFAFPNLALWVGARGLTLHEVRCSHGVPTVTIAQSEAVTFALLGQ